MSSKRFLLRATLSVAIFAGVLWSTDVGELAATIGTVDPRYLLLGAGLYVAGDAISAKKLQVLLRIRDAPFSTVWSYYYIGKLFNSFLPTTVGGDAVKARLLRVRYDEFEAYSGVFMERFTGLVSLLGIAIVAAAASVGTVPPFVRLVVYTVFLPAVFALSALFWSDRLSRHVPTLVRSLPGAERFDIGERVVEFHATVERYKSTPRLVALALSLSVAFHVVIVLSCIAFAGAVGMAVAPVHFFVFIPLASVILFLPISIGGFGVREAIYASLFVQVGATVAEGVALALLLNGMLVASAAVGAVIYVRE
ncbi:MAG: lysylphosphatidylglycerol synthase transmembrane domain-containing protein [Halalkalicoccus sp.]